MEKRGQVTLFIIAGILILVLIGFYATMHTDIGASLFGPPSEIKEIVRYTDTCVSSVAKDGAFMLSMQGGYINIPEVISADPKSYIEHGFDVPMWHYKARSRMPSVEDMENELEDYIDENLLGCLNMYLPFAKVYDITFADLPKTEATISDDHIEVDTVFPLKINRKGTSENYAWDDFSERIESRLGKMHELATALMDYETKNGFLEDYTDEMIACSDYLPYEGMEITCAPRYFFVSQMKDYTQQLVMHNLHFLQFLNTDYDETGLPYYDKLYKIDFTGSNYKDFKVNVIYNPEWDMVFEPTPNDNGIVKPYEFEFTKYVRSCVKIYHEKYNIEYPVLVQIIDQENAENIFYFATPVIIRNNEPARFAETTSVLIEPDELSSKKYCAPTSEITDYGLDAEGRMTTTTAEHNNRANELRVYAIDALYGYPDGVLAGVNISYQCVRFRCEIGNTGYDETYNGLIMYDALPKLKTGFPECTNGLLIANKPGYHQAVKQQTVSPQTDGEQVNIEMYKLKQFLYGIRVVQDHGGIISDRQLRDDEIAMIMIRNEEQDFEKEIIYPSDSDYYSNLSLLLGDFRYEVELMLVDEDTLLGGGSFNWTPSLSDLMYKDYITFYIFQKDPEKMVVTEEDMYELYKESKDRSVDYPPRFQ